VLFPEHLDRQAALAPRAQDAACFVLGPPPSVRHAERGRSPNSDPSRRIVRRTVTLNPGKQVPSATLMSKVLERRGMTTPRGRRRPRTSPRRDGSVRWLRCGESAVNLVIT